MLTVRNDKNLVVLSRVDVADRAFKAYEQGYKDALNAAKHTRKKSPTKAVVDFNGQPTEFRSTVAEK